MHGYVRYVNGAVYICNQLFLYYICNKEREFGHMIYIYIAVSK